MRGMLHLPGRDQELPPETDQILPVALQKCFFHQVIILRITVLDQCALHRLLVRIGRHVDLLHGLRIQAGVVHAGGYGSRRGIEILHLLRHVSHLTDIFRQSDRVFQSAPGV